MCIGPKTFLIDYLLKMQISCVLGNLLSADSSSSSSEESSAEELSDDDSVHIVGKSIVYTLN